ncbi:hypothetical protein AX16_002746 [Volvariella volvacea WC 439]|nr:hypothetical protein AX16_002746 [Volvariella volvacea WC 439]
MATPKGFSATSRSNAKSHRKPKAIARPGFGLPLDYEPSKTFPSAHDITSMSRRAEFDALVLREITMLKIMDAITDKPDWDKKIFDNKIVEKWKQELGTETELSDVTPSMFEWCLNELKHRSRRFSETGHISVLNGGVIKSDTAVDPELKARLRDAVRALEDIPERRKDWHPGSDRKVLDLVHPSLFPLVYGRTRVLGDSLTTLEDCITQCGEAKVVPIPPKELDKSYSKRFQWLPCEVKLARGKEGIKAKITSYINNLHPEIHQGLYGIIEDFIAKSVPLWNRTLTEVEHRKTAEISVPRIKYTGPGYTNYPDEIDEIEESEESNESGKSLVIIPDAPVWVDPKPQKKEKEVDLVKDFKDIQVIVKLANIHLTPEKREYEGGTWHIEGQSNEHIVATALYYYDNDNITPSRLAFRQQLDAEALVMMEYIQDDHDWLPVVYGMENEEPGVQPIGSVEAREGRLVTFPNVLQHQVQPFKLADATRPGHRKILALFLVDPNVKIVSTANVPCQRKDWWRKKVGRGVETMVDEESGKEFPIGMTEAKRMRLELMEERRRFVVYQGECFEDVEISLCEH